MLKMLRRLIGEDIDLAWIMGPNLWNIKMDPAQVDQILANLCVNARDAIRGVGKVTIETQNITFDEVYCSSHLGFTPGDYVMLAVSDDGSGMERHVLEHLFEPFFTTKGIGQGTGLGLSTVFGIVKQNDGFINVYSEPGKGTTFKIYFPKFQQDAVSTSSKEGTKIPTAVNETILLVEDEIAVLTAVKAMLLRLGYVVLATSKPSEAIKLAQVHTNKIDLLLTDVVMGEMNGRELETQIQKSKPGVKCLYMSGYTANVIAHRGVLYEGVHFLQKPFSLKDLAFKIREALDQK